MKLIVAVLLLSASAWATAYTASVTGNVDNAATFGGAGPPNCAGGDTVTINNAITLTINVTCKLGASPADDTGTPAVQCATTAGTGILNVSAGVTFSWAAPMRQCNATWTMAAGSTITYDSSGAAGPTTAKYSWQISQANTQANAKLLFSGSSGSHVTVNSVSNNQSGGFGNSGTAFNDGGNVTATYTDFSYQGGTASFIKAKPNSAAGVISITNCTIDHSGMIETTALNGASTFVFNFNKVTVPTIGSSMRWLCLDCNTSAISAITSGTRSIQNNSTHGSPYMLANTINTGFVVKNNIFWPGTFTATSEDGPVYWPGATGITWDQNMFALPFQSGTGDGSRLPVGTMTNSYVYRQPPPVGSNAHPIYVGQGAADTTITGWVFEYAGADSASDIIEPYADMTGASHNLNVTYNIFLPNPVGGAIGSWLNNSGQFAQTNMKFIFDHNTGNADGTVSGSQVYGVGCEVSPTTWPAGAVPSIQNNIVYNNTNGTGVINSSPASCTISNGAVTTADYNDKYNITSSLYGLSSAAFYNTTPGTHDFAVDPQFVDSTRRLNNFDQGYLGHAVATAWVTATPYVVGDIVSTSVSTFFNSANINWICTAAHTSGSTTKPGSGASYSPDWVPASLSYIETSILAGATFGSNSMIGELVQWVKNGYAPRNATLRNAGSDGITVGAVPAASGQIPVNVSGWF